MIYIRRATSTDAPTIADISRETFYDTFAEFNTKSDMEKFMSQQFSKQQLMEEVRDEKNIFFVAEDKTNPAGYIFLKENDHATVPGNHQLEISRLYVRKSFIGQGIGKKLMQTAIQFAAEHNKQNIWLGVWEHNQRAIHFYRQFGFEKMGEHDFILGEDVQVDWIMAKAAISY